MRAIATLALLAAFAMPITVSAQTAPPAAAAHYSTATTLVSVLMADPAAKAVLMKVIPAIAGSDQFEQAGPFTLKAVQSYVPDQLTDKQLADIDAEFAKLPAK